MQYIEAVGNEKAKHKVKLFLAGAITGALQWQNSVIKDLEKADLDITVFNPRRKDFPMDDPDAAEEQITWEFNKLREANIICFWFCKETLCPICLWELASALERNRPEDLQPGVETRPFKIIIGMDADYKRRQDVEIQTKLMDPDVQIHIGFESFKSALVRLMETAAEGSKEKGKISINQGR